MGWELRRGRLYYYRRRRRNGRGVREYVAGFNEFGKVMYQVDRLERLERQARQAEEREHRRELAAKDGLLADLWETIGDASFSGPPGSSGTRGHGERREDACESNSA
jgi:hypothetical protein